MAWPIEVKDLAVRLYEDGEKYSDIETKTRQFMEENFPDRTPKGVPMGTVIGWCKERGIKRDRMQRSNNTGQITVDMALERALAAEREVGRLQAEVDRLEALIDAYEEQLRELRGVAQVTS